MVLRYVNHFAVILIFIVSCFVSVDSVSTARADTDPPSVPTASPLLAESSLPANATERSVVSSRTRVLPSTPSPLPTAIPIDPDATPLPAPTVAPAAPPPPPPQAPAPASSAPSSGWLWPVVGNYGISSTFSAAHPALDIYSDCGNLVVASTGGVVVYSGWKDNGGGFVVAIQSGETVVEYNHLSSISIPSGSTIAAGTEVGLVGATGLATGCHLHLAVAQNGVYTDPLAFLP